MAVRIVSEMRRAARSKNPRSDPRMVIVRGRPRRDDGGSVALPCDAYAQSMSALRDVVDGLAGAGLTVHDVRYTRIHVSDPAAWTTIGRAHAAFFRDFGAAASIVDAARGLDPDIIVEFEVHALPGNTPAKHDCERCGAALANDAGASHCGWNCTFCSACVFALGHRCPNCSGTLVSRTLSA